MSGGDVRQGWRQGDVAGFQSMVEHHHKRLVNLVFRITGDYHAACDVVREAFVAAWQSDDPRSGGDLLPWLASIALLKAREGRPADAGADAPAPGTRGTASVDDWLQGCLEMLPYELREVIVLRDLEGFSYEQLGAILQVRQDLLRARLSRSREMLKNCLLESEGPRERT